MQMVRILLIGAVVLLLNIPFGYWRANVHRFSWQWALSIHIPVPFVVLLRIFSHIGFGWITYVVLVAAFFLGQRLGGYVHDQFIARNHKISSCLMMDLTKSKNIP